MPILAGFFLGFFNWVMNFVLSFLSRKMALAAAAVASFAAITVSLFAGVTLLLNGLYYTLPDWPGMHMAIWVAVPPIVPTAISIVLAADAAIALYRWNVENLKLISYIT